MDNYKEDPNQYLRTILFVILLLLFAFTFAGKSKSQSYGLLSHSVHTDVFLRYYSGLTDAVIFKDVHLPGIIKTNVFDLNKTSLNLFIFKYTLTDFNRRTSKSIILQQKSRLSLIPALIRELCFYTSPGQSEDLPALS